MANAWFRFKQFTVRQDRCAMKVGTDGVLLGAWTDYAGAARILDIGTGTGLLALIAAQRTPDALVDAVEIDPDAAQQARDNALGSPWSARIAVHRADIRQWAPHLRYDLILCNPPFYKGHGTSQDQRTAQAKHEGALDLGSLMRSMDRLAADGGRASLILPVDRTAEVVELAEASGFIPVRFCDVHYAEHRPAKRVLVELARQTGSITERCRLAVQDRHGAFTTAYRELLADLEEDF